MEKRQGLMTPNQQKFADLMWDNTGVMELADGWIIKAGDDIGLQKAKEQIPEKYWPMLYDMVDKLFVILGSKSE